MGTRSNVKMHADTIKRFWRHVDKTDECWVWTASKRNKGYGAFVWADADGRVVQGRAHRFAWLVSRGNIPTGMCVLHTCDNPACVRPTHLFIGTRADNNADMLNKGRHARAPYRPGKHKRGVDHPMSKLTPQLVKQLRADRSRGLSFVAIASRHGVAMTTAYKAVRGITWKEIGKGVAS